jgi:hypothetical protein
MEIVNLRLQNQHLLQHDFNTVSEVVGHLGAVQAQDFAAAKWALALRMRNASNEAIENAFNEGKILRTHIMRPTWHFVLPEDIRWMLELTSPRVKAFMAHYNRKLDLTDKLFAKTEKIIVKALKEKQFLTRKQLQEYLADAGVKSSGQRLGHIVFWAELDGVICSGPRIGKQFSYALLEDRAPKLKKFDKEQALAKLALKYFTSHGPAQLRDFAWWSGLSMKDARSGLDMIQSKLDQENVGDKIYWFKSTKMIKPKVPTAYLLSIFDEYTIAYNDRSDLSEKNDIERMLSMGNALTAVMIINGKVVGTWKHKLKKGKKEVKLNPFRRLTGSEKEAIEKEVLRFQKFHNENL